MQIAIIYMPDNSKENKVK